jgi:2-polyprenyl-3-methyl-5-hydroxy-6-metoxy-1,4-benzoquinol methylase
VSRPQATAVIKKMLKCWGCSGTVGNTAMQVSDKPQMSMTISKLMAGSLGQEHAIFALRLNFTECDEMEQQDQTLSYFKSHAEKWQVKATDQGYSLIENRHNAVLESMKGFPQGSSILDVGCGTGQLAIQASKLGWKASGIDFAQEMIDICRVNSANENANAEFSCASVFDYSVAVGSIDVISAQGFIEYIALMQLDQFLSFSQKGLKSGGVLALGSRNRLFNLHSLNEFTELESTLGTVANLLLESHTIQSAKSQQEAIAHLELLAMEYPQPILHPLTGVKVETRY